MKKLYRWSSVPAHDNLQDIVKLMERDAAGNQNRSPDFRLGMFQSDLDLQDDLLQIGLLNPWVHNLSVP